MRKHFSEEKKELNLKSAQLMAAFAEADPEPVFRIDETGKIDLANDAGRALLYSNGKNGKNLIHLIPEFKDVDLGGCIKDGKTLNIISKIKDKIYRFTLTGLPDMKIGQVYGSDITELKLTEDQLKLALKKAEQSEKIKSFFLAQMSHEIRSPLTAVLGFNAILKDKLTDRQDEDTEFAFYAIEKSGKRLTRTIDQLLYMSQFQTDSYETKLEKINISKILNDVVNEYCPEANLKKVDLSFENNLGDVYVYTDRYGAAQIFESLLDNAVKYTDKGSIKVSIGKTDIGKIFISIADTGIGMSEDFVKNLFKPFVQEKMGYNRPFEGNGLGLALSKKFADAMNAEILVKSAKEKGSEFKIVFNESRS